MSMLLVWGAGTASGVVLVLVLLALC